MESLGIIERKSNSVIKFYQLTEKGKELKGVFDELRKWGEKFANT